MRNGLLEVGASFRGYVILYRLGTGGTGEVYLARHEVLGANYAVKVVERESVECDRESRVRFSREVRTAAKIRHPSLVAVHDAGFDETTGLYFVVMDYLSGGTVADELRRLKRFPLKRALQIARAVVGGLQALEKGGFVHRDVKPSNMLVGSDGLVRLSDLGIVREGSKSNGTVTQLGFSLGTPAYMPYEQIVDSHAVDIRADIYALGTSLFEMLAGSLPDSGLSSTRVLKKRLAGERLPDIRTVNSAIPDWLAETILKMTDPDVSKRWRSLDELAELLDGHLCEMEPKKPDGAADRGVRGMLTRTRYLLVGALMGGLALAVVGGLFLERKIGRIIASAREQEVMRPEDLLRSVETSPAPQEAVPEPVPAVREILREVTNEVIRIVAVTTVVEKVADRVAEAGDALTNTVEGIEIRCGGSMTNELRQLSEMVASMAGTVRSVYGLPVNRPVQSRVRVIEIAPGEGKPIFDAREKFVRVGACFGGFPQSRVKMAEMCSGFMASYREGLADAFTAQVYACVAARAVREALGPEGAGHHAKPKGDPVVGRLLELECRARPDFLSNYFRVRREAYAKKKIVGAMTKHDFAAVVSLASGETVFPYLRNKGLKVDEFATSVKAKGLPRAEFFGE